MVRHFSHFFSTSYIDLTLGTDGQLAAALSGANLVNAAEIIRYTYNSSLYSAGWTPTSIETFSTMVQGQQVSCSYVLEILCHDRGGMINLTHALWQEFSSNLRRKMSLFRQHL
jgi:hypothetical protein